MLPKELLLELQRGHWERTPKGFYFPRKRLCWNGLHYWIKGCDDDSWSDMGPNLITDEGANHLIDVALHGTSPVATWYIAPFSNNVAPTQTLTAATFHSTLNELSTEYSESTRVAYVEAAASSRKTTNAASAAVFTAASASVNVWGAATLPVSTKLSTTAPLLGVRRFPAVYVLPSIGSTVALTVEHEITYIADV